MITIEINKTITEAIEEIIGKIYIGTPLTLDTMFLALIALKEQEKNLQEVEVE